MKVCGLVACREKALDVIQTTIRNGVDAEAKRMTTEVFRVLKQDMRYAQRVRPKEIYVPNEDCMKGMSLIMN